MGEAGQQTISISCTVDGLSTTGLAARRDLSSGERLQRSARVVAVCWGLALVTVFVPILHFVLVPGFLLLGSILGLATWMESALVLSGEISCPNCSVKLVLPRASESWPKTTRCSGCSYTLSIERVG